MYNLSAVHIQGVDSSKQTKTENIKLEEVYAYTTYTDTYRQSDDCQYSDCNPSLILLNDTFLLPCGSPSINWLTEYVRM